MKRDPSATEGSQDLGDQYKDERTEKKIHEHLNNEKDVISEEDIANAPAGLVNKDQQAKESPEELPESKKEELEEEKELEEKKVKDNEDPGIETAWNVLES